MSSQQAWLAACLIRTTIHDVRSWHVCLIYCLRACDGYFFAVVDMAEKGTVCLCLVSVCMFVRYLSCIFMERRANHSVVYLRMSWNPRPCKLRVETCRWKQGIFDIMFQQIWLCSRTLFICHPLCGTAVSTDGFIKKICPIRHRYHFNNLPGSRELIISMPTGCSRTMEHHLFDMTPLRGRHIPVM